MKFVQLKKSVKHFLFSDSGKITKDSLLKLGLFSFILSSTAQVSDGATVSGHMSNRIHTSGTSRHISQNPSGDATSLATFNALNANSDYDQFKGDNAFSNHFSDSDHISWDPLTATNHISFDNKAFHKNFLNLQSSGTVLVASHTHDVQTVTGHDESHTCSDHGSNANDHINCNY